MIITELVKEQIKIHYEKMTPHLNITYLKNTNKIMTNYLLVKSNIDITNPNNFALSNELDKKVQIDLKNELLEKQKAEFYYYYKSVEYVLGFLRKIDEYSYQMEVQKAFSSSSPLSMSKCNIVPTF